MRIYALPSIGPSSKIAAASRYDKTISHVPSLRDMDDPSEEDLASMLDKFSFVASIERKVPEKTSRLAATM